MQFSESFKLNIIDKYIIIVLYSFLPISFIIGNAVININIILIDILFIYSILKFKNFNFQYYRKDIVILLLILLYLSANSFYQNIVIKNNQFIDEGLIRSLGLIRYILFYLSTIYFLKFLGKNKNKIFNFWTIILLIVIFDIFYERLLGKNILNNISPSSERIASFFGDELIVGYFILGFGFICTSYLIENISLKKFKYSDYIKILFLILIPITIFITGERSNFIKSIILFLFILFFFDKYKLKINLKKFLSIFLLILASLIFLSENLKTRYLTLFNEVQNAYEVKDENLLKKSKHFYNYKMGYDIFLENKLFGVGNKKFREACLDKKDQIDEIYFMFGCTTHPHQTYLEILSENGLIGFILIFSISIIFIRNTFKNFLINKNFIQLSGLLFFVLLWIPFLPYGSLFSTTSFSLTIINISLARLYNN